MSRRFGDSGKENSLLTGMQPQAEQSAVKEKVSKKRLNKNFLSLDATD